MQIFGLSSLSTRAWWTKIPKKFALLPWWWSRVQFPGKETADASQSPWVLGFVLLSLSALIFFPKLNRTLLDPDEGRQAEIPREMLEHGDMVLPRMLGEPYYEKPPLQYWLTAGSYKLFGIRPSSARLIPATASWFVVLLTYWWACRNLGQRQGFLGGLCLCLSLGFVLQGRTVLLDSLLALCVAASWFFAHCAIRAPVMQCRWWLISAIACGLGILTKGPVALVLFAPPVLAYQLLTRNSARPRFLAWLLYVVVAAGIPLPWYALMAIREPAYLNHFFWHANFMRYVNPYDHAQPWWFYFPLLFAVTLPWSLLWPTLVYLLVTRNPRVRPLRNAGMSFCLLTAGWCFLFFSCAGCKSPPYLAPLYSPLALLIGICLDVLLFQKARYANPYIRHARRTLPCWITLAFLNTTMGGMLVLGWLGWQNWKLNLVKAGLVSTVTLTWWIYRKHAKPVITWAACGLATLILIRFVAFEIKEGFAARHSPASMAKALLRKTKNSTYPVVSYWRQWPSASFYFQREMVGFFDKNRLASLILFLKAQPKTVVLVESGEPLENFLQAIPHSLKTDVQLPKREGQAALVLVEQR